MQPAPSALKTPPPLQLPLSLLCLLLCKHQLSSSSSSNSPGLWQVQRAPTPRYRWILLMQQALSPLLQRSKACGLSQTPPTYGQAQNLQTPHKTGPMWQVAANFRTGACGPRLRQQYSSSIRPRRSSISKQLRRNSHGCSSRRCQCRLQQGLPVQAMTKMTSMGAMLLHGA